MYHGFSGRDIPGIADYLPGKGQTDQPEIWEEPETGSKEK